MPPSFGAPMGPDTPGYDPQAAAQGGDPSALGQLGGTLQGSAVMSYLMRQMQQQAQERAAKVSVASQAANEASQKYQQAAGAPPEQIDPLQRLGVQMGGNLGSILSRNPAYQEQAQTTLDQMHADLVGKRMANLQSLHDIYDRKAQAAQDIGNVDLQQQFAEKALQVGKAADQILQSQRDTAAMAREKVSGQNELANTAAQGSNQLAGIHATGEEALKMKFALPGGGTLGAPGEVPAALKPYVVTTASGNRFFEPPPKMSASQAGVYSQLAAAAGLPTPAAGDTRALRDIDRSRRDMDGLLGAVQQIAPKDAAGRILLAPGRKLSDLMQTPGAGALRSAFRVWNETGIPALKAMAGSQGLRISQPLIAQMISNIPRPNDTWEVAQNKARTFYTLFNNSEEPIISRNWQEPYKGYNGPAGMLEPAAEGADRAEVYRRAK